MKLSEILNSDILDPAAHSKQFISAKPFPHIVFDNFLQDSLAENLVSKFPRFEQESEDVVHKYDNYAQIKNASKGSGPFSDSAFHVCSCLQSDLFLNWLNVLTGIPEPLISDPYLVGGGFHESSAGGWLKVHADFNKHKDFDLDRRLNLIIYLNREWDESWRGALGLYDQSVDCPLVEVQPKYNRAVIFATNSTSFHGFPDPLACPSGVRRRSFALYYYSSGRSDGSSNARHSTLWKERPLEHFAFERHSAFKAIVKDLCPPVVVRLVKRSLRF